MDRTPVCGTGNGSSILPGGTFGGVPERLNGQLSKSLDSLSGYVGSNPTPTARNFRVECDFRYRLLIQSSNPCLAGRQATPTAQKYKLKSIPQKHLVHNVQPLQPQLD